MEQNLTDWISSIGSLFLGVAALLAFFFGGRQIQRAQLEIQEKRLALKGSARRRAYQADVAEESIELFGKIPAAFQTIRRYGQVLNEEAELREMHPGEFETENLTITRESKPTIPAPIPDKIKIPFRISKYHELFSNISDLEPKFLIVFETNEPFLNLWRILRDIEHYASIIDETDESPEGRQERKEAVGIVRGGRSDDAIKPAINAIVAQVMDLCKDIVKKPEDAEQWDKPIKLRRWFSSCP